jgi:hypothetical protein
MQEVGAVRPVGVDLGVGPILVDVVVEEGPTGRRSGHQQVKLIERAVGERNRGGGRRAGSPREIALPGLPQIRTGGFPASGSSSHDLAA